MADVTLAWSEHPEVIAALLPVVPAGSAKRFKELDFSLNVVGFEVQVHSFLVRLAVYTGLRAGEIGALRVGRLDLLRGRVEVVESVADVRGRLVFGPTKTHERRTVRMPRLLATELGAYLGTRPHAPDDLVFTGPHGGPLRHHDFYRRHFKPAVRRAARPTRGVEQDSAAG
jgi:integrase